MATLWENGLSGTLSAGISNSDTTLSSAGFADLPAVSGGDQLYLVLDADESAGAIEVVTVTAHTASATTVTVSRGAQGSAARSHLSGTDWVHSVTAADLESFLVGAADEVATAQIQDGAVTTAKLAADAVDGTKLADDSVDSEHYVDGSIDTVHIADGQVTTAKLADGAVTFAKEARTGVLLKKNHTTISTAPAEQSWDSAVWDSDSFWSSGTDITIPAGKGGIYELTLVSRMGSLNFNGYTRGPGNAYVQIDNGSLSTVYTLSYFAEGPSSTTYHASGVAKVWVDPGDVLSIFYQFGASGSGYDVDVALLMVQIDDHALGYT